MKTLHPSPSKFEGNESQLLAGVAYSASLDGSNKYFGDVQEDGFFVSLVLGKKYGFIVEEDSNGFVSVWFGNKEQAIKRYDEMETEFYQNTEDSEHNNN